MNDRYVKVFRAAILLLDAYDPARLETADDKARYTARGITATEMADELGLSRQAPGESYLPGLDAINLTDTGEGRGYAMRTNPLLQELATVTFRQWAREVRGTPDESELRKLLLGLLAYLEGEA